MSVPWAGLPAPVPGGCTPQPVRRRNRMTIHKALRTQ